MFTIKKKYYLFVENTRDLNFNLIKIRNKFNIVYRNKKNSEKIRDLQIFRNNCKKKGINLFIANNTKLLSFLKADGLYISASNKNLLLNTFEKAGYKIIGSAHNLKEVNLKIQQGCKTIIYSRLFETNYDYKKGYLGVIKFNIISQRLKMDLVPLGSISADNLGKINFVSCSSIACLSAIKKKPANIINRLF